MSDKDNRGKKKNALKGKMYCINLLEREDRYNAMIQQFKRFDLEVEFFRTHKHPKGGMYGCFDSHIHCLKDARKNDLDYCIIFEDDNIFYDNADIKLKHAIECVEKYHDIDMIFLHNRHLWWCKKDINKKGLFKCFNCGNSCILYSKKMIHRVLETYKDYIGRYHMDIYLWKITFEDTTSYIPELNKLVTYTAPSKSDNDPWDLLILEYFRLYIFPYSTVFEPILNFIVFNLCKISVLNYLIKICKIRFSSKIKPVNKNN